MLTQVIGWCALLTILFAGAIALWGLAHLSLDPRTRCPGTAARWRRTLIPTSWLIRPLCGYDLTGLPVDADLTSRCPECGRRSAPRHRLRTDRRFRPIATAVLLWVIAAVAITLGSVSAGSWTRLAPSLALVALERHAPARIARPARREVFRRLDDQELADFEVRPICALLIADLADDERSMNATNALDRLRALWPSSRHALEAALTSPDRQTRFLAGEVLRDTFAANPPDALLNVCVENLAEERGTLTWFLSWGKVTTAAQFLIEHIERAEPLLERVTRSGDQQQRLIAAAIIAECQRDRLIHLAAPILIEHLRDNNVEGDAQIAVPALLAAGERMVPYLEPLRHDEDTQRRQLARAILAHYGHPTDPAKPELDLPPRITALGHDALVLPPLSRRYVIRLYWP